MFPVKRAQHGARVPAETIAGGGVPPSARHRHVPRETSRYISNGLSSREPRRHSSRFTGNMSVRRPATGSALMDALILGHSPPARVATCMGRFPWNAAPAPRYRCRLDSAGAAAHQGAMEREERHEGVPGASGRGPEICHPRSGGTDVHRVVHIGGQPRNCAHCQLCCDAGCPHRVPPSAHDGRSS